MSRSLPQSENQKASFRPACASNGPLQASCKSAEKSNTKQTREATISLGVGGPSLDHSQLLLDVLVSIKNFHTKGLQLFSLAFHLTFCQGLCFGRESHQLWHAVLPKLCSFFWAWSQYCWYPLTMSSNPATWDSTSFTMSIPLHSDCTPLSAPLVFLYCCLYNSKGFTCCSLPPQASC